MRALLDLETKLEIVAKNPCHCVVCARGASIARAALREVSPSAAVLLDLQQGTDEFDEAERKFHADEVARLQAVYEHVSAGECVMPGVQSVQTVQVPQPEVMAVVEPHALPEMTVEHRNKLERYRMLRASRIEPLKKPRVPGSYVIK
jgi:hypothetical protein